MTALPPELDRLAAKDVAMSRILKGLADGTDTAASNLRSREEELFEDAGGLPNPYPPEVLVRLFEKSSALRPCVDALVTNIHGFGHRLKPLVKLDAKTADAEIANAILSERIYEGAEDPDDPTPAEVAERRVAIERGMVREKLRLETFFCNCADDGFIELRKQLWTDLEITGNAYIEVLRDATGRISRLVYAPATNMRLRRLDRDPIAVTVRERMSPIAFAEIERFRRFRSFVQIVNGTTTHFKEFGDPRVRSSSTGRLVSAASELSEHDSPATEILHFRVFSSRSSYGIARWIGAAFEVMGIRAVSEVNYLTFDNKAIPPMAVLVSGGALSDRGAEQIAEFMDARLKGRQNWHSVLVLEAESSAAIGQPASANRVRIELKPLAQPQDGVFLTYADLSEDVVGRQFRLSPITRGKTRDAGLNRATADAALRKDEQQVFQPERVGFDQRIEKTILTDLGIRYWTIESNSPVATDPEILARIVDLLVKNNTLTPEEARVDASNILNRELEKLDAPWTKQPVPLTLGNHPLYQPADVAAPTGGTGSATGVPDIATLAQRTLALRDELRARGDQAHQDAVTADAKAAAERVDEEDGPLEVIKVPAELFERWVKPQAA